MNDSAPGNPARPGAANVEMLSTPLDIVFPDAWYDKIWSEHFWVVWRLRATIGLCRDLGVALDAPARFLEVGCGSGILRRQLEQATAWTVDGADINRDALSRCLPGRGRNLCYNVLDRRPELLGRYDGLALFDIIEHIDDVTPFLDAALAHLRPGGLVLVNVPALPAMTSVYDRMLGHVRRYTRASLIREFDGLPARVRQARYWGFSLLPFLAARKFWVRGETDAAQVVQKGMVPPGPLAHAVLRALMRLESSLVSRPPLGSSLLLAAEKTT